MGIGLLIYFALFFVSIVLCIIAHITVNKKLETMRLLIGVLAGAVLGIVCLISGDDRSLGLYVYRINGVTVSRGLMAFIDSLGLFLLGSALCNGIGYAVGALITKCKQKRAAAKQKKPPLTEEQKKQRKILGIVLPLGLVAVIGFTTFFATAEFRAYRKIGLSFIHLSRTSGYMDNNYAGPSDAYICQLLETASGVVKIPNTYRKKPVVIVEPPLFTDEMNCIENLVLPDSITEIREGEFDHFTEAITITVPDSVTKIGDNAFLHVANVAYHGSASGAPWGARAMNGYVEYPLVYADESKTELLACSSACNGDITVPDSVTEIGNYAFYLCTDLNNIAIPDSVTAIGEAAFYWCKSLTDINVPNSATHIGDKAFQDVLHITYNGSADGSPWGAKALN